MLSPSTTRYRDLAWLLILWGAAILLFCIDLGGVPLRDWDEGTVAQVAREIAQRDSWTAWLYPQLWGQPYLNKPPFLHGLIAMAFQTWEVHAWTARLPGAFLTATAVPMLYLLGREIFPTQLYGLMGAGVYLTLLPVVRHGRLAMLDGTIVFFFIAMLWLWMRSRRHPPLYLVGGLCFALMCLTKGILGVLLLFIAILFLAWDSPKELRSPYLWGGILLGSIPVVGWYGLQWQLSGESFVQVTLLAQNFGRIWDDEGKTGPPWYYLLELLKYSWPWLIFWPTGIWLTWKNRNYTWAKLLLVWTVVFFVTISVMGTKLPWYVYPIYPALACTMGVTLTAAWNIHRHWNDRSLSFKRLPRAWGYLLGLFSVIGAAGVVYASPWGGEPSLALVLTFFTLMVATGLAALFVFRQQARFIPTLMVGCYLALLFLVNSDHWVWELGESFPVMPVANLVQDQVPPGNSVYTDNPYHRPSLSFYSNRQVIATPQAQLLELWQTSSPIYILVQNAEPFLTDADQVIELGQADDWKLIVKQS